MERIRLPKNSRDGDVLRMEGHGLLMDDGRRGDQFVELAVEMPRDMSAEQLRGLSQVLDVGEGTFPKSDSFEKGLEEGGQ